MKWKHTTTVLEKNGQQMVIEGDIDISDRHKAFQANMRHLDMIMNAQIARWSVVSSNEV